MERGYQVWDNLHKVLSPSPSALHSPLAFKHFSCPSDCLFSVFPANILIIEFLILLKSKGIKGIAL